MSESVNLEKIVEELSGLTVMQIADLTKRLEEKWGVKAAPVAVAGAVAAGGSSAGAEKPAEQTEFEVTLTEASNKLGVIKIVRDIHPNFSLKEAKDFVDVLPKSLKSGLSKADAEALKAKVAEAGGKADIK